MDFLILTPNLGWGQGIYSFTVQEILMSRGFWRNRSNNVFWEILFYITSLHKYKIIFLTALAGMLDLSVVGLPNRSALEISNADWSGEGMECCVCVCVGGVKVKDEEGFW